VKVTQIIPFNCNTLALSVKYIELIPFVVVKRLQWKVIVAIRVDELTRVRLAFNLLTAWIIQEVIMSPAGALVQSNKEELTIKLCRDKGVWKAVIWHRRLVDAKGFVDVKSICLDFFIRPHFFLECSYPELAIVKVRYSEVLPIRTLLYLFDLNVLFWIATYLLLEHQLERSKTIHLDPVFILMSFCNGYYRGAVICDHAVHNWIN